MNTRMLPPALVDLTLARLHAPHTSCFRRHMQSAALAFKSPETLPTFSARHESTTKVAHRPRRSRLQAGGLAVRQAKEPTNALAELTKKVEALEQVAAVHEAELQPLEYTEEQLLTIYEDLLSHPEPEGASMQQEELDPEVLLAHDISLVESLDQRLATVGESSRMESLSDVEDHLRIGYGSQGPHQRVLGNIQKMVERINSVQEATGAIVSREILSDEEWASLLRVCLNSRDSQSAELALGLMKDTDAKVTEKHINAALECYVERGDPIAFEESLARHVQGVPTEDQRHLHIKVHLKASPPDAIPVNALSVLHEYENKNNLPAMRSYSKVIKHLFTVPTSAAQAHAWDLFSHMRYVAHPDPDIIVYTQMIRACASFYTASRQAEPERALDLWHEMTIEKGIKPTTGAYNAVILACARSGRKSYVNEAFRLAKEMLDANRDAFGRPAYAPDLGTFKALLDGAKRIGDLGRVRWILAEMIGGRNMLKVDEEVMVHVFHGYARYKVPFKRELAKLVEAPEGGELNEVSGASVTTEQGQSSSENSAVSGEATPTFTHIPPQSRHEVLTEVDALLHRIEQETKEDRDISDETFGFGRKFDGVQIGVKLLNSYLAVHYRHNTLERSRDLFWSLYDDLGVERNARTYVEAMERCATSKISERKVAKAFANEIMNKWDEMQPKAKARVIERLHAAYIKVLTITDQVNAALSHLRTFVAQYPPSAIRDPESIEKPHYRSTRTSLVGSRPLVRITSAAEVPDDGVPPLLTWSDLEVLHHRLIVRGGRDKDIGYIKYVSKAYEWALRVRRDEAVRRKPAQEETGLMAEALEEEDQAEH